MHRFMKKTLYFLKEILKFESFPSDRRGTNWGHWCVMNLNIVKPELFISGVLHKVNGGVVLDSASVNFPEYYWTEKCRNTRPAPVIVLQHHKVKVQPSRNVQTPKLNDRCLIFGGKRPAAFCCHKHATRRGNRRPRPNNRLLRWSGECEGSSGRIWALWCSNWELKTVSWRDFCSRRL